ncbi:MAG: APC family permease [Clostridia bacterium]|nr:APC family permease [Clostridia bacterium]
MGNKLEQKFGLVTAICMVVGIVIGSGVFFKAVDVLHNCGGDMGKSLLVIGIVGLICIVCSCVFASMSNKYAGCNGVVDYAEVAVGPRFAYNVGWFMSTMYYPIIASTLAFISARYAAILLGFDDFGFFTIGLGAFFLMCGVCVNALAPKLAGKLQVSMTVIKLIPLLIMGVIGTIIGLANGNSIDIFEEGAKLAAATADAGGVFAGVCAFAFAYEGWIIATTINSELRNPKKDLPKALIVGALFCTAIYMIYVFSMSATMSAQEILDAGNALPKIAFSRLFHTEVAGTAVMVFIIISCLGTMNGITMAMMRGFHSVAIRGQGPKADIIAEVDESTGMPLKSCIIGALCGAFWYFQCAILFFNGPCVTGLTGNPTWLFGWEADEIVIITLYAFYIPIFLFLVLKGGKHGFTGAQRFLAVLGTVACLFLCYCCFKAWGPFMVSYLVTFAVIMLVGNGFYKKENQKNIVA